MGETIELTVNDTSRAIRKAREDLDGFDSPLVDKRIKAMVSTKLQEAFLLSLLLIKEPEESEE